MEDRDIDVIEKEIAERKQAIAKREEENHLVTALVNNETAIEIAKQQYEGLKNQKNIVKNTVIEIYYRYFEP